MRYGAVILVVGSLGVLAAQSVHRNASASNNWTRPDADPGGTRYSTLTQINTSNVQNLTRAWTFRTNSGRFAGAPMVVDNVMYFSAPNGVYALNATTGALIWRYPAAPTTPPPASPPETTAAPAARGGGGGFASVGSALFGEGRGPRGLGRGGADAAGTATRGPTYWEGTAGVRPRVF